MGQGYVICIYGMYVCHTLEFLGKDCSRFCIKIVRLSYAALQPKTRERQPESNNRETLKQLWKNS